VSEDVGSSVAGGRNVSVAVDVYAVYGQDGTTDALQVIRGHWSYVLQSVAVELHFSLFYASRSTQPSIPSG